MGSMDSSPFYYFSSLLTYCLACYCTFYCIVISDYKLLHIWFNVQFGLVGQYITALSFFFDIPTIGMGPENDGSWWFITPFITSHEPS